MSDDIILERLRLFMRERRLPQDRWAKEAGLGERTLGEFMSGRTKSLTNRSLAKLAAHQGLTVEEMLGIGQAATAEMLEEIRDAIRENSALLNKQIALLTDLLSPPEQPQHGARKRRS